MSEGKRSATPVTLGTVVGILVVAVSAAELAGLATGQEKKAPRIQGPRYIAYDHNNVIHLYDRLGELKPPGEKDEHAHIPEHFERGFHATLSRDADFVAYASLTKERKRDVVIWQRSTKKVLTLPGANSDADDDHPSISADGNLIAFNSQDQAAAKTAGIRLYDRRAGKLLDLPDLDVTTNTGVPALSPEGRFIAFSADKEKGNRDLFLYDREEKKLLSLPGLNSPADDWSPRVSKNASWIAFCSKRPGGQGGADVYLYDRDKARLVDLPNLNTKADESECDLSADGRFLAYLTNRRTIGTKDDRHLELLLYDRQSAKLVELPKFPHQTRVHFSPAMSRE
jgi:Tol biopolymer transport system component